MKATIKWRRKLGANGEWVSTPVYTIDGREVTEAQFKKKCPPAKDSGKLRKQTYGGWPKKSFGPLNVHPDQVKEANERAKAEGLTGVYYRRDGQCIISGRDQFKKLLKVEGMHDKDAFC